VSEKDLACARKCHPAGRPQEESRSELVFETSDLAADGGLGNPKVDRRPTDVPLFGHRHEVLNLSKTHGSSLYPETPPLASVD
jgi:hypothetical protein